MQRTYSYGTNSIAVVFVPRNYFSLVIRAAGRTSLTFVSAMSISQPTLHVVAIADRGVLNKCFKELDPRLRHVLQACNSRHTPDKMRSGRGISIRSSSAETVFFDSSAFPSCLLSPASAPGSRTEKRKKLLRSKTYGEDTT